MYAICHSPYHKVMDFSFAEKKKFKRHCGLRSQPLKMNGRCKLTKHFRHKARGRLCNPQWP